MAEYSSDEDGGTFDIAEPDIFSAQQLYQHSEKLLKNGEKLSRSMRKQSAKLIRKGENFTREQSAKLIEGVANAKLTQQMREQSALLMEKSGKYTRLIKRQSGKIRSKWRKAVTGDEKKRIRDALKETQEVPGYVKLVDKVGFTMGVLNICVCQYFFLNKPEYFWLWYAVTISITLISRIYHFYSLYFHYFLFDFCYFVIGCSLLNLFVYPTSSVLFKMGFIYSNGSSCIAILVWRNSFVFHDFDKIASIYVHILPAMFYYCVRWTTMSTSEDHTCLANPSCTPIQFSDYVWAILGYVFWQILYLLKTEMIDKEHLDSNPHLLTSLRWLAQDTKNAFCRKVLGAYRKVGAFRPDEDFDSTSMKTKMVFVFSQLIYSTLTFAPTWFLYNYQTLHMIYLVFIFTMSVFNGASFYIEVFSKRYNVRISKMAEMHKIAKEAQAALRQHQQFLSKENLAALNSTGSGMDKLGGTASGANSPLRPARSNLDTIGEEIYAGGDKGGDETTTAHDRSTIVSETTGDVGLTTDWEGSEGLSYEEDDDSLDTSIHLERSVSIQFDGTDNDLSSLNAIAQELLQTHNDAWEKVQEHAAELDLYNDDPHANYVIHDSSSEDEDENEHHPSQLHDDTLSVGSIDHDDTASNSVAAEDTTGPATTGSQEI